MIGAFVKSAAGHAAAILLAWAGLPSLFDDSPPGDSVIVVEMVTVAARRNLPSAMAPPPEPAAEARPAPAPPSPPAPLAAPPPAQAPAAEPRPAAATVAALAPAPEPVARVDPAPAPTAAPPPIPARPKKKPPPPRPPEGVTRPREKPRPPRDFDRALEDLEEIEQALPPREAPPEETPADPIAGLLAEATDSPRLDAQLSMTEIDAIRQQIRKNWAVPAGAENAHEMTVILRLRLGPDGAIIDVALDDGDRARMGREPFFRTFAESAVRAARRTERLEGLRPEAWSEWRDMKVRFNPEDMFDR